MRDLVAAPLITRWTTTSLAGGDLAVTVVDDDRPDDDDDDDRPAGDTLTAFSDVVDGKPLLMWLKTVVVDCAVLLPALEIGVVVLGVTAVVWTWWFVWTSWFVVLGVTAVVWTSWFVWTWWFVVTAVVWTSWFVWTWWSAAA